MQMRRLRKIMVLVVAVCMVVLGGRVGCLLVGWEKRGLYLNEALNILNFKKEAVWFRSEPFEVEHGFHVLHFFADLFEQEEYLVELFFVVHRSGGVCSVGVGEGYFGFDEAAFGVGEKAVVGEVDDAMAAVPQLDADALVDAACFEGDGGGGFEVGFTHRGGVDLAPHVGEDEVACANAAHRGLQEEVGEAAGDAECDAPPHDDFGEPGDVACEREEGEGSGEKESALESAQGGVGARCCHG